MLTIKKTPKKKSKFKDIFSDISNDKDFKEDEQLLHVSHIENADTITDDNITVLNVDRIENVWDLVFDTLYDNNKISHIVITHLESFCLMLEDMKIFEKQKHIILDLMVNLDDNIIDSTIYLGEDIINANIELFSDYLEEK